MRHPVKCTKGTKVNWLAEDAIKPQPDAPPLLLKISPNNIINLMMCWETYHIFFFLLLFQMKIITKNAEWLIVDYSISTKHTRFNAQVFQTPKIRHLIIPKLPFLLSFVRNNLVSVIASLFRIVSCFSASLVGCFGCFIMKFKDGIYLLIIFLFM